MVNMDDELINIQKRLEKNPLPGPHSPGEADCDCTIKERGGAYLPWPLSREMSPQEDKALQI